MWKDALLVTNEYLWSEDIGAMAESAHEYLRIGCQSGDGSLIKRDLSM